MNTTQFVPGRHYGRYLFMASIALGAIAPLKPVSGRDVRGSLHVRVAVVQSCQVDLDKIGQLVSTCPGQHVVFDGTPPQGRKTFSLSTQPNPATGGQIVTVTY